MKLDFDSLYNECKRENFALGKEIFYDDAVKNILTENVEEKTVIKALVTSSGKKHAVRLVFDETGGLYEYSCDCGDSEMIDGPCAHVIAAALSYEEKHPYAASEKEERKSDADVTQLVFVYNKLKRSASVSEETRKAELVPHLTFDGGTAVLSFTVGYRKQYVVKDIAAFLADYRECKFKRYGVALELYHTAGAFSERANALIRFISKCYAERGEEIIRQSPSVMRLTPSEFDRFFTLFEGKLVNRGKSEHYAFSLCDAAFPVRFFAGKVNGGYIVKMNCPGAQFINGRDYLYAAIGNRVFKMDESFAGTVCPLMQALGGSRELFVSQNDMIQFYNSVLKTAAGPFAVESDDDLSVFDIPPLNCKTFITCENKSVALTVKADYAGEEFDILSDNYTAAHLRDWDAENGFRAVLMKYFPAYPVLLIADEGEIFDFLKYGVRSLGKFSEVLLTESMERLRLRSAGKIRVGIRLELGTLGIELKSDEFSDSEVEAIMKAYGAGQKYILLGGGFVDLDDRSLDVIGDVLADAQKGEGGKYVLPAHYAAYLEDELRENGIDYTEDDGFNRLVADLAGGNSDVSDLPTDMANVLREYQKTGYNWLKKLSDNGFGGILADDMGLGKTLQVLALLSRKKCSAIIICPTTLLLNWQDEINKFAPSLKSVIISGSLAERKALIESAGEYDVLITSYDLIRRDAEFYAAYNFDYAVADEAQNIKNPETKNAQAVKSLNAKRKFALTGTPVENHLGELWSIFDFVMPGFFGRYEDFRENYEEGIVAGDDDCAEKLRKLIMPFVLRRLKSDVLKELPPKVESKLTVMLDGEQKALYVANMKSIRQTIDVMDHNNTADVLSMLMRLRELCCHPSLVYPGYAGNSAKLESCLELVREAVEGGHKVLLFSQFTSMLDVIAAKFAESGISFYMLTGNTPKTERLKLVKSFNTDDTSVFLISLKAGGTGLNLTGADIVIHYDPWWNESVMNQATDRAYRIGQNKSVHIYKLILGETIEESIYELQRKKSALSGMVVGAGNNLQDIIKLIKEEK